MLDLLLLRAESGGDPGVVRESEARRGKGEESVDRLVRLDASWREATARLTLQRTQLARRRKELSVLCREGGEQTEAIRESRESLKALAASVAQEERSESELHAQLQVEAVMSFGVLV